MYFNFKKYSSDEKKTIEFRDGKNQSIIFFLNIIMFFFFLNTKTKLFSFDFYWGLIYFFLKSR